ncbi:hypothetical protein GCM10015535_68480 [Streptomyces gelaticus]|uniref:Uncharacterized protein n=1 Tax=Streptomyces gelaticus TaxID=285446 RepID=A0ABQ2WBU8_9ACTN|nr:hypothetical protein GCM10015535_68480 [Streptomyces gelaticus]
MRSDRLTHYLRALAHLDQKAAATACLALEQAEPEDRQRLVLETARAWWGRLSQRQRTELFTAVAEPAYLRNGHAAAPRPPQRPQALLRPDIALGHMQSQPGGAVLRAYLVTALFSFRPYLRGELDPLKWRPVVW